MGANNGQFDHQNLMGFVRSTIQICILTFLVFSKCCVNMSYAPLQVLSLLIMMSKSEWHHSQLIETKATLQFLSLIVRERKAYSIVNLCCILILAMSHCLCLLVIIDHAYAS